MIRGEPVFTKEILPCLVETTSTASHSNVCLTQLWWKVWNIFQKLQITLAFNPRFKYSLTLSKTEACGFLHKLTSSFHLSENMTYVGCLSIAIWSSGSILWVTPLFLKAPSQSSVCVCVRSSCREKTVKDKCPINKLMHWFSDSLAVTLNTRKVENLSENKIGNYITKNNT